MAFNIVGSSQKLVPGDAILIVVKELDRLNGEKQLPTLGALNIVIRELETLV